jgi:hypothetical protein
VRIKRHTSTIDIGIPLGQLDRNSLGLLATMQNGEIAACRQKWENRNRVSRNDAEQFSVGWTGPDYPRFWLQRMYHGLIVLNQGDERLAHDIDALFDHLPMI